MEKMEIERRKIRPSIYLTDKELDTLVELGGTVSDGIFEILKQGGVVVDGESNTKEKTSD